MSKKSQEKFDSLTSVERVDYMLREGRISKRFPYQSLTFFNSAFYTTMLFSILAFELFSSFGTSVLILLIIPLIKMYFFVGLALVFLDLLIYNHRKKLFIGLDKKYGL